MTLADDGSRLSSLVTVAAMVAGFGILAFMFRIQRELDVQELNRRLQQEGKNVNLKSHLAVSDALIIGSIIIAALVIVMLIEFPRQAFSLAVAACLAAVILQCGFLFSIFAHYGIFLGKSSSVFDRKPAQPGEVGVVILTLVIASTMFIWVLCRESHASNSSCCVTQPVHDEFCLSTKCLTS
jgi:hypothetical protein